MYSVINQSCSTSVLTACPQWWPRICTGCILLATHSHTQHTLSGYRPFPLYFMFVATFNFSLCVAGRIHPFLSIDFASESANYFVSFVKPPLVRLDGAQLDQWSHTFIFKLLSRILFFRSWQPSCPWHTQPWDDSSAQSWATEAIKWWSYVTKC
jgi:hypothetical protein